MAAGRIDSLRIARSIERVERALEAVQAETSDAKAARAIALDATAGEASMLRADGISAAHARWADEAALRSLLVLRGSPGFERWAGLVELDDDLGGPHPAPSRAELASLLPVDRIEATDDRPPLVAIFSDPRAWKGRAGLSHDVVEKARACFERWPNATLLLFGHPRLLEQLHGPRHVLLAWGGEPLMQRAAARWLLARGAS
jgi:hypothetical protein